MELGGVRSFALRSRDRFDINDLDASWSSSVSSSHIHVELVNCSNTGGISELFVDVVGSGSTIVSNESTEVLQHVWFLLTDLVNGKDFSGTGLHLVVLRQEVPESRLGDNGVDSKDSHSVQGWLGVVLCRLMTTNNLIFSNTHCSGRKKKRKFWYVKKMVK